MSITWHHHEHVNKQQNPVAQNNTCTDVSHHYFSPSAKCAIFSMTWQPLLFTNISLALQYAEFYSDQLTHRIYLWCFRFPDTCINYKATCQKACWGLWPLGMQRSNHRLSFLKIMYTLLTWAFLIDIHTHGIHGLCIYVWLNYCFLNVFPSVLCQDVFQLMADEILITIPLIACFMDNWHLWTVYFKSSSTL